MRINKDKLKLGIWYTDDNGNVIEQVGNEISPKGARLAHVCFPLEITEKVYSVREDGGYGEKQHAWDSNTTLCKSSGRLAVAMVNSGDYDLEEALAVLAQACERCVNVLWDKYLPGEDGYAEHSEEWCKANTVCEFCKDNT